MAGPYQREVYDNSRSTGRLVDLIARRGDTQARLALERGDIAARTANDIGGIVSGTLSSLAKQSVAERERKDAEARQQREDARRAVIEGRQDQAWQQQQAERGQALNERVTASRFLKDDGTYDTDGMAEAFKQAGIGDRFPSMLEKIRATEKSALDYKTAQMKYAEAERVFDSNLAGAAKHAISLGVDPLVAVRTQVEKAKFAGRDAKSVDAILAEAEKNPGNITQILDSLIIPEKTKEKDVPKAGTFEDFVTRAARENGVTPEQLTTGEVASLRRRYEDAGRAPEKPKDEGVTPAQRAIAKRTFDNAVTDAEAVFASAKRAAMREGITPEAAAPMIAEAEAMRDRAIRRARATFYETTQEAPPTFGDAGGRANAGVQAEGSAKVGVKAGGDARVDVRSGRSASNNAANNDRPSLPASVAATAPMSEPRMGRSQAAPSGGAVLMKLPDGRVVPIYADKVEEAKRLGAVEVR